jgi:DNA repair exonuclease SbcCD nuclease subunit
VDGVRILHTADWQIGKPFEGVEDAAKRAVLRQERIRVVDRVGEAAARFGAGAVVVCGDLFDSFTPDKSTVCEALAAIGRIGMPVFAIPGNHDHAGPGSIWQQEFFAGTSRELAPNLQVLTEPLPFEAGECVFLPCPLVRRQDASDPTAWLRTVDWPPLGDKPRVVIAHGSTRDFAARGEDGEPAGAANRIALERIPDTEIDYIALGDWHGTKQAGPKAWYAGTPEPDRFPKGGGHAPGNVLLATLARGRPPVVEPARTGRIGWHRIGHAFTDDTGLERLVESMARCMGARANEDLVHMTLEGSLGIARSKDLESLLDTWRARLLRLKIENHTRIAPSEEEVRALTSRASDPLVSMVAKKLLDLAAQEGDEAPAARVALRELHAKAT